MQSQRSEKVLIADDHRMFNDAIAGLLGSRFARIGQVFDGHQLLFEVRQNTPDLLLLDINLPGINGLDAAQKITASFPAIKIIIVTMYNQLRMVSKVREMGLSGYILKDSPSQYLLDGIEQVLDGKDYFDPGISSKKSTEDEFSQRFMLTYREKQIIQGLVQGKKAKEIADELCLAYETVKSHRKNIYFKLEISSLTELIHLSSEIDLAT